MQCLWLKKKKKQSTKLWQVVIIMYFLASFRGGLAVLASCQELYMAVSFIMFVWIELEFYCLGIGAIRSPQLALTRRADVDLAQYGPLRDWVLHATLDWTVWRKPKPV